MDAHIRTLRKEELLVKYGGPFDEENAERVVSWLVAAENRRPVILVGAGFTLNARDVRTGRPATRAQAPLWSDVVSILAKDLGVSADRYDAPTLFEMYGEHLKEAKLRDALHATVADADLEPGKAHQALAAYPSEAIVTTNCLDTLLDKACGGWRRVVVDEDLSMAGEGRDLIYLHGHRDFSDSWVMKRSQYEDFPRKRPVMLARVRQLLAQHPWLVVGFGMTDPNFHAITRLLGLEMRGHQPLSLALMRDTPLAAERSHWQRLGFEIASPVKKDPFDEFLAKVIPKLVTTYSPSSTAAKGYIERGRTLKNKLSRFRDVHAVPIVDRAAVSTTHALFALFRMLEAGLPVDVLTPYLHVWKRLITDVKTAKTSDFSESKRAGFLLERKLAGTPRFEARSATALFEEWFGRETSEPLAQREEQWATLVDVIYEASELVGRLGSEVARLSATSKRFVITV